MMEQIATTWWIWLCLSLVLALIELLVPATVFLGFALGALATAVLVAVLPVAKIPALLAMFALASLIAWLVLRLAFRRQSSGARIVKRDINEG